MNVNCWLYDLAGRYVTSAVVVGPHPPYLLYAGRVFMRCGVDGEGQRYIEQEAVGVTTTAYDPKR